MTPPRPIFTCLSTWYQLAALFATIREPVGGETLPEEVDHWAGFEPSLPSSSLSRPGLLPLPSLDAVVPFLYGLYLFAALSQIKALLP